MERARPPGAVRASEFVVRLAREISGRLAPEESAVFDDVAAAWRAGVAQRRAPGGSVGFGIEDALVSAIVVEVIAASVAEVLALGTAAGRSWWRRWRARGRPGSSGRAVADAVLPAVDGRIVLTEAQAVRLREVSRRHARTLGLDDSAADLLADAVVGAVHVPETAPTDGHS
ncbi:hypothetical protein [Micromonospora sp. URMC 103]|uniref:hypothetical protein n=1 Tax=Micromonospora sp. URMC 103 TaxID=3423406 RepID=UPI003F1957F4